MELEEFVSETIKSIIKGVNSSKELAKESNVIINPNLLLTKDIPTLIYRDSKQSKDYSITTIDFDVAVTVGDEDKLGGKAGINVYSFFNASASGESSNTNVSTSRIKFPVNILLKD